MEMEMGLATGRASINSEAPDDLACCSTMAGVSREHLPTRPGRGSGSRATTLTLHRSSVLDPYAAARGT